MHTPETQQRARLITEDDQPKLPCWMWSPVQRQWTYWTRTDFAVAGSCLNNTHWHPDQLTSPTCVPGAETTFDAAKTEHASLKAQVARERANVTSLPPAETSDIYHNLTPEAAAEHEAEKHPHPVKHPSGRYVYISKDAHEIIEALYVTPHAQAPAETGTLETDAAKQEAMKPGFPSGSWVPADFARRLERERDEARRTISAMLDALNYNNNPLDTVFAIAACGDVKDERDEARAEVESLRKLDDHAHEVIASLRAQLTTLRAQADAMAVALEPLASLMKDDCMDESTADDEPLLTGSTPVQAVMGIRQTFITFGDIRRADALISAYRATAKKEERT